MVVAVGTWMLFCGALKLIYVSGSRRKLSLVSSTVNGIDGSFCEW